MARAKPAAYLAPSLRRLRAEIDAIYPNRDKRSDGWIGDAAHAGRVSDHNPDPETGVVRAIDVDADGIAPRWVIGMILGDPRLQYVIFDRTIWSRTYGWAPRRYTGPNPHTGHMHVSIRHDRVAESKVSEWIGDPHATARPAPRAPDKYEKPVKARPGTRTIRLGSAGTDVAFLQRWLDLPDDGLFGPATHNRVQWYQRMRGLTVDGIVGPKTWREMRVI